MTEKVPLALAGRVYVNVTTENGPIQPGDLLTTSSTAGYAMKAGESREAAIIGKALGSLADKEGRVMAALTLQ
jgi:hypothetical protein